MAIDFEVSKTDLREHRCVDRTPIAEVRASRDEAVLRVDTFAFTANNVTYGALGDAFRYWQFFPADDGWGRIPVWGFGTVVASPFDDIPVGARYYGYFPMSTYVAMQPGAIKATTFSDAVPHRAALHPLYNQYTLTPPADATTDAMQLLYRPLFLTSFILDDYFSQQHAFGAERIIVSSASSKTAYGMAYLVSQRLRAEAAGVELVGLTSERNVDFVRGLGFYDRVLPYAEVASLEALPSLFVDFAANAALREAVHARLGDRLRFSSAIGLTHWDQSRGDAGNARPLPGPAPETFFAPAEIKRRIADWGAAGFAERFDAAWASFTTTIRARGAASLHVRYGSGPDDVAAVYDAAVTGALRPEEGQILTLSAAEA